MRGDDQIVGIDVDVVRVARDGRYTQRHGLGSSLGWLGLTVYSGVFLLYVDQALLQVIA